MRKRNSEHLSDDPQQHKKRISPSGNILPTRIPNGEIITDLTGKQWRVGKNLGSGGFGDIYIASDLVQESVRNDAPYVIKVENHASGPLFVEINCLLRIARLNMINEWKDSYKFQTFGMPHYIASGSCVINKEKLRFLVLPRFEQDLEQVFVSRDKKFNLKTVVLICSQILDVLEYIHSKGYVHCDIKASNILHSRLQILQRQLSKKKIVRRSNLMRTCKTKQRGHRKYLRPIQPVNYTESNDCYTPIDSDEESEAAAQTINQVTLIDYGLATKFRHSNGQHKAYCHDERKAHAGTILFCSRDAHSGVSSRRSDLETLGYNMIYWLTSNLPWSEDCANHETVHRKKQEAFADLDKFLVSSFTRHQAPVLIYKYFTYVKSLAYETRPDYSYCKRLFQSAITDLGYKTDGRFDFENLEGTKYRKTKLRWISNIKHSTLSLKKNKPMLRKKNKVLRKTKLNWSNILIDPEEILRQNNKLHKMVDITNKRERTLTDSSDTSCTGNLVQTLDISRLNPTYAMVEVFNKCRVKHFNGYHKPNGKGDGNFTEHREGYTPAMNMIITKMYRRKFDENIHNKTDCHSSLLRRARSLKTITKKLDIKKTKSLNITKEIKRKTMITRVLRGNSLRG